MARARRPGEQPSPPTRGPTDTPLYALLTSRRFRLGAGCERVAQNLALHGGTVAADAAAWVGSLRPPEDAPSIGLGSFAGTLGPRSFGFVNVHGQVAPFDAPLPSLPRRGGLALVVPARDALPDLGPLALARGLGLSWIVSVGDGDPAEAVAFVHADAMTASLALVLGAGASGASLRAVLGAKPAVVWGGDPLCRAVARRAGAAVIEGPGGLGAFLAHTQLLDAGVTPGAAVEVIVVGGGRSWVEGEVREVALEASVQAVDERAPDELAAAIAGAAASSRPIVLVAGTSALTLPSPLPDGVQLLSADLRQPEHLRALLTALASPAVEAEGTRSKPRADKELAARVRHDVDATLSDHDAKRLLKAYGARVTRQAPTNTPTGAVKLAKQIGVPCVLATATEERVADNVADVRRLSALLLQSFDAQPGLPSVMVRERFPEVPRARVKIAPEKGLGLTMRVGGACALLPLTRADALALAAATAARRAADQRAVADLLTRVAACAADEDVAMELELYVGAEPAVLSAAGELRRRGGAGAE